MADELFIHVSQRQDNIQERICGRLAVLSSSQMRPSTVPPMCPENAEWVSESVVAVLDHKGGVSPLISNSLIGNQWETMELVGTQRTSWLSFLNFPNVIQKCVQTQLCFDSPTW